MKQQFAAQTFIHGLASAEKESTNKRSSTASLQDPDPVERVTVAVGGAGGEMLASTVGKRAATCAKLGASALRYRLVLRAEGPQNGDTTSAHAPATLGL